MTYYQAIRGYEQFQQKRAAHVSGGCARSTATRSSSGSPRPIRASCTRWRCASRRPCREEEVERARRRLQTQPGGHGPFPPGQLGPRRAPRARAPPSATTTPERTVPRPRRVRGGAQARHRVPALSQRRGGHRAAHVAGRQHAAQRRRPGKRVRRRRPQRGHLRACS